ncbi:CPBP family intramembrane glutamic endopeptidase [Ramlibacter sp. MMS24-I3-19]|uniref:CPBP family intramembrane glutamic endopeptidase n=1 Tax=Ramlibacter sp. MMS24-I3-19 TaxID=3416606 RepID=UPI003CFDE590
MAFRTPDDASSVKRRALYSPVARAVLFGLIVVAIGFALRTGLAMIGVVGPNVTRMWGISAALMMYLLTSITAYLVVTRLVEGRWPKELLRGRRLLPDVAIGLLCGAAYISACAGALWLAGAYTVVGVRPDIQFAGLLLVTGVGAGVFEEIVFRGVLFRMIEEGLGTWAALLGSALLFGFVHIANPGATAWSSIAIAIEAGLLLGMAYHVTRSLPLCMGIHAAWNFTQGAVYGSPVSGLPTKNSWLIPQFSGPEWLTGGAFGFEASVVSAGIGLAIAAALVLVAQRRGTLVPWRPNRSAPAYHGVQAPAT